MNVYNYSSNEIDEHMEISQTSLLKLFDENDGVYDGYFVLSSIYTVTLLLPFSTGTTIP